MKNLHLMFLVLLATSCSNPLDKSIFESLTVEELKDAIQQDSTFEATYKYVKYVNDSVLVSEIDRVKWSDLTYKRLQDYIEFGRDTTVFKPIYERTETEWQEKYGVLLDKVDSISNYWKTYKEENSLSQYVKIEPVELYKETYTYSNDIKNVNLGFRLTPLKGSVQQLRFSYEIEPKLNEDDEKSIYSSLLSGFDKSWCYTTDPFSKPVVRYWEANYSNEKILKNRSFNTLMRDFNIKIEIDEIRKGGVNMSDDDLNIPESVENHWKYEDDDKEYMRDLYADNVIEECLKTEFVSKYDYQSQEVDKVLLNKDELCFNFFGLKYQNQ